MIILLVCALCLPLPSLHDSDFYEIFLLLVYIGMVHGVVANLFVYVFAPDMYSDFYEIYYITCKKITKVKSIFIYKNSHFNLNMAFLYLQVHVYVII